MSEFIPLSVPNFGAREAELAGQAITSGWVSTSGGKVTEFEEALAAYVKRIAGVDALQWINGEQAERLIETMKKWAMRFLPQAVKALVPQVGALELSDVERGQLNAVLNKAFTRQTFDPMHSAWESLNDVLKRGR